MPILPDVLLVGLLLLTICLAAVYGRSHENWMMLPLAVTLAWMAFFYAGLAFHFVPDTVAARQVVFRPGFTLFLLFLCVFLANGRINRGISYVHCHSVAGVRRAWPWILKHFKRSARS